MDLMEIMLGIKIKGMVLLVSIQWSSQLKDITWEDPSDL